MKLLHLIKGIIIAPLLFTLPLSAQHKLSFDLAAIRQMNHHAGGMNMSSFYYFNNHLVGGAEMNRFFPVTRGENEEEVKVSAWDFEINFHYLLPVMKHWNLYPVTGISHTSEKEADIITHHNQYERFWSVNTGAGLQLQLGHWLPHIEYTFTWGQLNQQFLLAGVSYDIELGRHAGKQAHH